MNARRPKVKTRQLFLKVKISSLASEQKIIRKEEKKLPGASSNRVELWQHRTISVRKEIRLSLLAYAFIRGKSYLQCEQSTKTPLKTEDLKKIRGFVQRFGAVGFQDEEDARFQRWVSEAGFPTIG